jgi:predicted Zn finger-like uncharacterized protein
MTLATRCPACQTTFRVVQDQLKVSGGWVRCGKCSEVFNAIAGLFDVAGPAAAETRKVEPPAAEAEAPAQSPATMPPTAAESIDSPAGAEVEAQAEAAPEPEPELATDAVAAAETELEAPPPPEPAVDIASVDATPEEEPPPPPAPRFVRDAERAARWRRPGMRWALASAAGLLSLTLLAQVAYAWRDLIAARSPALRPWLTAACGAIGCTIEPLRRIAALSVETSGLQQLPGTTIYKLSLVLRNRDEATLLLPAFELVLTGAQGEAVLRRVLSATELGSNSRTIGPGVELAMEANLNAGDRRISGYTIEAFYP